MDHDGMLLHHVIVLQLWLESSISMDDASPWERMPLSTPNPTAASASFWVYVSSRRIRTLQ